MMKLKPKKLATFIILLLVLLTFSSNAFASGIEKDFSKTQKIFVSESGKLDTNNGGGLLFLLCSGNITEKKEGAIFVFMSQIEVTSNFKGEIFSLFSAVSVENTLSESLSIKTLSSQVSVKNGGSNVAQVKPLFDILKIFMKSNETSERYNYSDEIPSYILKPFIIAFNLFICLLIFAMRKSFSKQGAILIEKTPLLVLRNGILVMAAFIVTILLMAITVVFLPFSFILVVLIIISIFIGETAIGIYIGYSLLEKIGIKCYSFIYVIVGVFLIELSKIIPFFGLGLNYIFVPIFAIGVCVTALYNGGITKRFYENNY